MAKAATSTKPKPPTKSEIYSGIAEKTGLSRKQVASVFDALGEQIGKSLKKNSVFAIPGLCRMVVKKKPATKARKGRHPVTGEEMVFKAKPASKSVRIRPLKGLKEMVA